MSFAPIRMAITTPEPAVMPKPKEIMTNRLICEILTAAMASDDNLLTITKG